MVQQRHARPHRFSSTNSVNRPRRLSSTSSHDTPPPYRDRTAAPSAKHAPPSVARLPPSAGKNARPFLKALRLLRPNAQLVTTIATSIVLFAITILVRASAIIPPHAALPSHDRVATGRLAAARADAHPVTPHSPNVLHSRRVNDRRRGRSQRLASRGDAVDAASNINSTSDDQQQAQNLSSLVASDGSHFLVDLSGSTFTMRYTGTQFHLSINTLNRRLSTDPVPLAFFIQISNSTIALLPRLLVVMWHPDHIYLIHLDEKISTDVRDKLHHAVNSVKLFNNIHFLPSDTITYKGVSMLLNTLSAMEYLLHDVSHDWQFFINLSGSDYPLVNTHTMAHMLSDPQITSRNMSFLQLATDKAFWKSLKQSRFDYIYYDTALAMRNHTNETSLINTWVRHPILNDIGVEFVQSEAWVIAHRSFAQMSVRSNTARKLLLLLSMMQDPEEHFFAMLAWNTPSVNASLAHHAFRAIFWELHGKMSGQHPYYIDHMDEHGEYPFWQGNLAESRCFFARKVRTADSQLLGRIDQFMSGTHQQAHVETITSNMTAVHDFVQCIARVDEATDQIRGHNICGKI